MRHTGNIAKKLRLASLALFLGLLLPTGALAGVKQDAADPTVRLPAAIFGLGHSAASAVNVSLDDNCKDKDKKCKEHKDDCDAPATEAAPAPAPEATPAPAPTGETPDASWSGLPVTIDA